MKEDQILKIVTDIAKDLGEFKKETRENFKSVNERLDVMDEKLNELKSSANTLDDILVEYPVQRIERLENHCKLPKFVPTTVEE